MNAISHHEFAKKIRLSSTCNANHTTFGGRCLNCGYDPGKAGKVSRKTRKALNYPV